MFFAKCMKMTLWGFIRPHTVVSRLKHPGMIGKYKFIDIDMVKYNIYLGSVFINRR